VTLSTCYEELNSNSDLDMNGMLMEECITTLSAVRWVENESTPCPPGFLTYNATIASFTRISKSYTALRKELGTTSEKRGMSVLRISEGRIAKWAPGPGSRRLRGLHASMHPLKMKQVLLFVLTQPPGGEHGMIESCGPRCDMYLFFTR